MKTALLIVDVQNYQVMNSVNSDIVCGKVREALDFFRESGLSIFHIRHTSGDAQDDLSFEKKIHDSAAPAAGETLIEKKYPNAFKNTDLLARLIAGGIQRIVVCGMFSNMCVEATVRAGVDFGFKCVVLHDACSAMPITFNGSEIAGEVVHRTTMATLNMFGGIYADLKSVDEFING